MASSMTHGTINISSDVTTSRFTSLGLVESSRFARSIAKALLILLLALLLIMLGAPWRQSATGSGRIITYDPNHRMQEVDAPISGRLVEIRENLVEGSFVQAGDLLMEIEVIDQELVARLEEQYRATQRKLQADRAIVLAYGQQVEAFKQVREQTELAQDQMIKVSEQKLLAEQEAVGIAAANLDQYERDRIRRKGLFERGVESRYEYEVAERRAKEAARKVEQTRNYVTAAEAELSAKRAERLHKIQEADAKIQSASAVYQKALGDLESTTKEVADIQAKRALQKQPVRAPMDGYLLRLRSFQGGQIVSQGQPLLELVPSTEDRAVEIKVDGNDAPLVASHGPDDRPRKVRLQFEGWPAVQFSGWPSVAVGTFGGIVKVVDRYDDGTGKFRVLVVPDPEDRAWPSADLLRQGVRANGWVLLDNVSLGFEVWRQFNGFPPVVEKPRSKTEKPDKLLRGKK